MSRSVLGLDVGGANLKAAHTNGAARSRPFALWKDPGGLTDALRGLIAEMPPADVLAVTMTGELCDCFESKRQGVLAILDAVEAAAAGKPIRVWSIDGRFHRPGRSPGGTAEGGGGELAGAGDVRRPVRPGRAGAADRHRLDHDGLRDAARRPPRPVSPHRPGTATVRRTGLHRRPPNAALRHPGRTGAGGTVRHDAGSLPRAGLGSRRRRESRHGRRPTGHEGRRSRPDGADALHDLETSTDEEREKLANRILLKQVNSLQFAVERVSGHLQEPPRTVVLAGEGEFLALPVLNNQSTFPPCPIVGLWESLGREISRAACALCGSRPCRRGMIWAAL